MFDHIEREIRHDPINPWPERFRATEALDIFIRFYERFLREIFRVMRIAHDVPGDRHDALRVLQDEIVVRAAIAVLDAGDGAPFQRIVLRLRRRYGTHLWR